MDNLIKKRIIKRFKQKEEIYKSSFSKIKDQSRRNVELSKYSKVSTLDSVRTDKVGEKQDREYSLVRPFKVEKMLKSERLEKSKKLENFKNKKKQENYGKMVHFKYQGKNSLDTHTTESINGGKIRTKIFKNASIQTEGSESHYEDLNTLPDIESNNDHLQTSPIHTQRSKVIESTNILVESEKDLKDIELEAFQKKYGLSIKSHYYDDEHGESIDNKALKNKIYRAKRIRFSESYNRNLSTLPSLAFKSSEFYYGS